MREGKQLLDRGRVPTPGRTATYAELQRRSGETMSAQELAMTRRPRGEDAALRAVRFTEMQRRGEDL
jgi:hypothetical protein